MAQRINRRQKIVTFVRREEIERNSIEITTITKANKLKPNTLVKQYKNVLSE